MNCQECERLFDDMIDRHGKEPTRQRMELHLSRCGTCRDKLEHRQKSHALIFRALNGTDGRLYLPKDFADRLVAECNRKPKRAFFPSLPRWALIAASLAIMAGFVFAATVVIDAVTAQSENTATDGGLGEAALPVYTHGRACSSNAPNAMDDDDLGETTLPSTNCQLPTTNYLHSTNQGEFAMKKSTAATAALASAMAAAPLTAARGDGYQYIISGDPVAAETVGSSSASSTAASLTSGTLAGGFVLTSELEARSRTIGESAVTALRSDKFNGTFIIFK